MTKRQRELMWEYLNYDIQKEVLITELLRHKGHLARKKKK